MCLQSDILEFRTLHFRLIAHSMGSMSLLMPACKQIKLNSQSKSSHITTLNPLFKTKFFDGWKTTLMPQWFVKRFIWLKFYIVKKRYEFPENMAYGWKKNYMRSQIFSKSTENTNAIKHQMEVVILHTPLISSHTHYRYNEFKIHRKIQTTISLTSSLRNIQISSLIKICYT